MRDRATTPAVYTFHLTRPGVLVALLGVVAIVLGFMSPASASVAGKDGAKDKVVHKSYVCKYVGTPGVDERLQTGNNPIYVDNHSIAGKDVVKVGDRFPDAHGSSVVIVANTEKLDPEPGIAQCPGYVPPTTTTTQPTTEPPTTTTTEPTTEPPTTTTTEPGTQPPTTDTPSTGATSPSSTSKPVAPVEESPDEAATVAPTTPLQGEPSAAGPEVGAIEENAVPQAQTDGADLVEGAGWTALQSTLVGAGLLLLAAGGLLSVRRERVSG